jgi:hypothetical protein
VDVVLVFGKFEGHELMRRHPSKQAEFSASAKVLDLQLQLRLQLRAISRIAKNLVREKHCTI